jgi:hypothetical protein
MDVVEIIKELRQELERIDSLILALDMLQSGRRRGRPPKLLQQLRSARSRPSAAAAEIAAPSGRKRAKKRKTAAAKSRKKAVAAAEPASPKES